MNLLTLDLNLLLVFDSILRTKSTTLAATELSLTQSSVSNALKRLRTAFDDPLFVKTRDGMVPTAFAQALADHVREGLASFRRAIETRNEFDPTMSNRSFTLYVSDVGQMIFIPKLVAHLASTAPNLRIITVEASPCDAQREMAIGEIDLAIGWLTGFGATFHQQLLFREHYVAMVRADHPRIAVSMSMKRFLEARHAVYRPTAGSHTIFEEAIEQVFEQHGRTRNVAVRLAHSFAVSQIISASDYLICVPSRLACVFAEYAAVKCFPLPFSTPAFEVSQYWHERAHHDEGHRWLRNTIAALFATSPK